MSVLRTQHNRLEFFVGLCVIAISGWFLYVAYHSSNQSFSETYKVYALFNRIDGVNIGSDIKISGVKVGYVKSYTIDPKTYQAKVELAIRKDLSIPSDSIISIVSESLLGGKYMTIQIGMSSKTLKEQDIVRNTQSSVNLESMISKYMFGGGEKK